MEARILIVDDDPDIRLGLQDRLRWLGHEVSTAEDGERALELIQQEKPDLVLLDVEMPKLNGLEVLTRVADKRRRVEGHEPGRRRAHGKSISRYLPDGWIV